MKSQHQNIALYGIVSSWPDVYMTIDLSAISITDHELQPCDA